MNLTLAAGGGSNAAMLTNLTKLFTALSDIKNDSTKPKVKEEKLPFLDLVVKLQFSVDVEIWIDCFKGIEDSTAKFKASAMIVHGLFIRKFLACAQDLSYELNRSSANANTQTLPRPYFCLSRTASCTQTHAQLRWQRKWTKYFAMILSCYQRYLKSL